MAEDFGQAFEFNEDDFNAMMGMGEDSLDAAFDLPTFVTDNARLQDLHRRIVNRLRKESEGVPMDTIQLLLLERIAFNYIVMKAREMGELDMGNARAQKDFQTFWLAMTNQFSKNLQKATAAEDREKTLREVRDIVIETLSKGVDDKEMKMKLLGDFSTAFANAGI